MLCLHREPTVLSFRIKNIQSNALVFGRVAEHTLCWCRREGILSDFRILLSRIKCCALHRNYSVRLLDLFLQIHRFPRGVHREPNVPSNTLKSLRLYETHALEYHTLRGGGSRTAAECERAKRSRVSASLALEILWIRSTPWPLAGPKSSESLSLASRANAILAARITLDPLILTSPEPSPNL